MPIIEKNKPLGLEEDDESPVVNLRRFLQLPCGTLLAYGGDEGTITAMNDGEFKVVHQFDDMVRAVAVSKDGKRIIVGFDDGGTKVYTFDEYNANNSDQHPFGTSSRGKASEDDFLSQDFISSGLESFAGPSLGAPVRDLQFVRDYWVAAASESGMVLIDVTSSSTLLERQMEHLVEEHHSGSGIRGVAVHKNLLATLAMDGRVCLWDTEKQELVERESVICVPKRDPGEVLGADCYDRCCRPCFCEMSKAKTVLATPGKILPTLRVFSRGKLEEVELENLKAEEGHLETVTGIYFLKCSEEEDSLILTTGRDARLVIWKWNGKNKITHTETFLLKKPATHVVTTGSQAYVACSDGTYSIIDVTPHMVGCAPLKTASRVPAVSKKAAETSRDDDSDSGVDFADSSSKERQRVRFVDDEAGEEEDEGEEEDAKAEIHQSKSDQPTFDGDDFQKGDRRSLCDKLEDLDDAMADLDEDLDSYKPPSILGKIATAVPPQPAFSPASTPLDLARRFLCWNHIGAVTLLHGDDRNTVDITFTDSAYKRPISFTDNMNFILGSLGDDGAIFASDLQIDDDDDDTSMDGLEGFNMSETTRRAVRKSRSKNGGGKATGSAVFFYRFSTIGSIREKDWYLTLPSGERVWSAATGQGWAAVATSRRFLRFFSCGGNQGQIVWLKGDPVTMVGRGRFMAVVYHDATPTLDGTQQLAFMLWDASNFEIISEGPLSCLSKGASLNWLGFSNGLALMAMDSEGVLSMLVQTGPSKWEWSPVLDTIGMRKSMDDQFWPITVYDGKMVCVPLKGGNSYPDANRKPVTSTLGLRMPLAPTPGVKTSQLEEINVRSNLALAQNRFVNEFEKGTEAELEDDYIKLSAQVDKVTLKLFSAFVDANKIERAADLVGRLHTELAHDLAMQIAGRNDKLADIAEEAKYEKFVASALNANGDDIEEDECSERKVPQHGSPKRKTSAVRMDSPSRHVSPECPTETKRDSSSKGNLIRPMGSKKQRVLY